MHADQVNQVFSLGISSAYLNDMLVDSVLKVYIREVQTSGSLFGRVGNLFFISSLQSRAVDTALPDKGVGGEGTVGSAGCL